MPSPFPGMDPFIESQRWKGFHTRFITTIAECLEPFLRPRYVVDVEDNLYLATPAGGRIRSLTPDASVFQRDGWLDTASGSVSVTAQPALLTMPQAEPIEEHCLVLRARGHDQAVTVIELLSPTNKSSASGRAEYLAKRAALVRSDVNIVEIDLLRGGQRLPTIEPLPAGDHFTFVSRAVRRPQVEVYAWLLEAGLPTIPIPLAEGDPDVPLELLDAFNRTYDRAGFSYALDYGAGLEPPIEPARVAWLASCLANVERRGS